MALVSDTAICLRKLEYSETSQIVTLLTPDHGLIRVIAKGAHRTTKAGASRFDGGVDLLDEGIAQFTAKAERDLNTLTEWKITEGRRYLRTDLRRLNLGLYLAELISNLFEVHDPHPNLFERFRATLDELATPALEESAVAMMLDTLRESGFVPMMSRCVNCSKPTAEQRRMWFSLNRGGAICQTCQPTIQDARPTDPKMLLFAVNVLLLPRVDGRAQRLTRLTRPQASALHRLMIEHVQHASGREVRTAKPILSRF
jgi:DNA repair protein RecO (recombination protein O)